MSGQLPAASPHSTRDSSASVAETTNPNSFTEEHPVGYFKSEDEEAPDQDDDGTDSDDVLWVGWDGPDDPADPKK